MAEQAKGLITREVDPADTRARRLHVTPAGAALVAQLRALRGSSQG